MNPRPAIVVCEDGDEYTTRFVRLLGQEVELKRASNHAQASRLLSDGAVAILLDLDFRRTNSNELIDESGATNTALSDGERRRLAEIQGILILRALRSAGSTAPAILFADLDDPGRGDYLARTLAPLTILASSESLPAIARHIRALVGSP